MKTLRRVKSALPILATAALFGVIAVIIHLAPSKPESGLAAAIEQSLKD